MQTTSNVAHRITLKILAKGNLLHSRVAATCPYPSSRSSSYPFATKTRMVLLFAAAHPLWAQTYLLSSFLPQSCLDLTRTTFLNLRIYYPIIDFALRYLEITEQSIRVRCILSIT